MVYPLSCGQILGHIQAWERLTFNKLLDSEQNWTCGESQVQSFPRIESYPKEVMRMRISRFYCTHTSTNTIQINKELMVTVRVLAISRISSDCQCR